MDQKIEISVIIPVYNADKVLERCVDSILRQINISKEIILIDDGSLDLSLEICRRYETEYPEIQVYSQKNAGVSNARNTGITHAKGTYVVFVDSDDSLPEGYLYQMLNTAKQTGAFVLSSVKKVVNHEAEGMIMSYEQQEKSYLTTIDVLKVHEHYLFNQPWNKLYTRQIIEQHQIQFPEDLSLGEDMMFNMQYWQHMTTEKVVILNQNHYLYTCDQDSSLSRKYIPNYYDIHMTLMDQLSELCDACHVPQEERYKIDRYRWRYQVLALENTMKTANTMSLEQKIQYNSEMMKKELFQDTLKQVKKELSLKQYILYRLANYKIIYEIDRWKRKRND